MSKKSLFFKKKATKKGGLQVGVGLGDGISWLKKNVKKITFFQKNINLQNFLTQKNRQKKGGYSGWCSPGRWDFMAEQKCQKNHFFSKKKQQKKVVFRLVLAWEMGFHG